MVISSFWRIINSCLCHLLYNISMTNAIFYNVTPLSRGKNHHCQVISCAYQVTACRQHILQSVRRLIIIAGPSSHYYHHHQWRWLATGIARQGGGGGGGGGAKGVEAEGRTMRRKGGGRRRRWRKGDTKCHSQHLSGAACVPGRGCLPTLHGLWA